MPIEDLDIVFIVLGAQALATPAFQEEMASIICRKISLIRFAFILQPLKHDFKPGPYLTYTTLSLGVGK